MTFTHDGLRDNLTNLAAPPFFYENLKRELSAYERTGSPLILIRFVLAHSKSGEFLNVLIYEGADELHQIAADHLESTRDLNNQTKLDYSGEESLNQDLVILNFAEHLNASLRREDLCARLGIAEFVTIFKGARNSAEGLSERILAQWNFPQVSSLYSILEVRKGESALETLSRLDAEPLQRVKAQPT